MTTRRSLTFIALALVATLTGCSSSTDSRASTTASPSPVVSASPALPPSLVAACDRNDKIRNEAKDGDLTSYGDDISQIYQDAPISVPTVHEAAQDLHNAWSLAATNKGQFTATAGLLSASIRLSTACIKAGWAVPAGS